MLACVAYLKVVKLFEGTSMIRQFHNFLNLISDGFLLFGPTVLRHEAKGHNRETKVSFRD